MSLDAFFTFIGMFLLGFVVEYLNKKFVSTEINGKKREFYFKNALFVIVIYGWFMLFFNILEQILTAMLGTAGFLEFQRKGFIGIKVL